MLPYAASDISSKRMSPTTPAPIPPGCRIATVFSRPVHPQVAGVWSMTADRAREHTAPAINARIDHETAWHPRYLATKGDTEIIARILELDREWDVERALEANGALRAAEEQSR